MKHLTFAIAAVLTIGTLTAFGNMQSASAVNGTFTEWDAIAPGQPVRDFNPHITVLDETGNTGFGANTPWYTIDNRSPGLPCALGHTDPATDTLCSWGFGGGVPIGVAVDQETGRVWVTLQGIMIGGSTGTAHVAFLNPGAGTSGSGSDTWTHMRLTSNAAGITLDSAGNAYFAEQGTSPDSITKTTPTGDLTRWSLSSGSIEPRYLAFDSTGENLYFTTACSRDINRLNIVTNVLTTWAYPTAGFCSFSILDAFGIFLQDDDSVWYADTTGNVVARLTPSTDTITEFSKAMNAPSFIVVSSNNQAFITERFGNTVDILDIDDGGGVDTAVVPTVSVLTKTSTTPGTVIFDRDRICRVQPPTVTVVEGIDPPSIIKFPLPTAGSQPIGMTDVVETLVGDTLTTGIFGDEFSFSSSKIFLFESSIIIPPGEIIVDIDIKPGSDPSSVICKANKKGDINGIVPVAIFGADNFDVSNIDIDTLQLNGVDVTEEHDTIHIEDLNADEFPDAVLHLDKAGVCEATADDELYPLKESADAILTGSTTEDPPKAFEGTGDIRIVKR